jgi:hypothetical protein
MDPPPKSPVEKEYEHMISFHKWIVQTILIALGILIAGGLGIFYRDMSQVRSQGAAAISETKDAASREISKVRDDAAKIAIDEARKRVEDAFRNENIQAMIETAAKRQVGPAIDRRVRQEVDLVMTGLQGQISSLGEIADLAMRMRIGLRSGLEGLILRAKTATNESERRMAQDFLARISSDYETFHRPKPRGPGPSTAREALSGASDPPFDPDNPKPVPAIVRIIREESNLNAVALAFLALGETTGHQFRMFDIEGVQEWCKEHAPVCAEPTTSH